ncbi:ROK family protein [Vibrio sp. ZSDZ34]|uniref:N-acetylglucosamine kinase n=1 Tax=Vibrio gelatinilyticus TaxID=2893468 RepID=A0A9X2AZD0_9VIBR|nr:ROK family protein [Vibrio gelatinilyticus]MCJ2377637.1 ROK family protein [Vibrio gelatinilyticus]
MLYYGLDIGGTKIELRAYDACLQEVYCKRLLTPAQDFQAFIDTVAKLVLETDAYLEIIGAVGIGIPGSESTTTKRIFAPNIPAIDGREIRSPLEDLLKRKIHLANDADCFAISESKSDSVENGMYVLGFILGTGFGGGLAIAQQAYLGSNGMPMEVGHTPLNMEAYNRLNHHNRAPLFGCECGKNGCLDRYLSGTGFEALYLNEYNESLPAIKIIEQYRNKEAKAVAFVNMYIDVLVMSIAPFVNIFDPDSIVLGGGLSNFEEMYALINERLPNLCLERDSFPLVSKAKYGDSSGVRGAAMLALDV